MAERSAKRRAGATRITRPRTEQEAHAELLAAADVASLTRFELERIATGRGLDTTGTDAQLRTRITDDITADRAALASTPSGVAHSIGA